MLSGPVPAHQFSMIELARSTSLPPARTVMVFQGHASFNVTPRKGSMLQLRPSASKQIFVLVQRICRKQLSVYNIGDTISKAHQRTKISVTKNLHACY